MSGLTHEEKIWYWLASTPRLGFKHMVSILEMQISLEEIFADPGSLSMLPEGMRETLKGRADIQPAARAAPLRKGTQGRHTTPPTKPRQSGVPFYHPLF